MTLLWTLLRSRITWGAGICLVLGIAGRWAWRHQYQTGYTAGVAAERSATQTAQAIADAISDSAWQVMFARGVADRAEIQRLEAAAKRAGELRAKADARAAAAIAQYDALRAQAPDSGPVAPALLGSCDRVRTTCDDAQRQSAIERDSVERLLATARAALFTADSNAALEPARQQQAIARGVDLYRRTQPAAKAPSRLRWLLTGGLVVEAGRAVWRTLRKPTAPQAPSTSTMDIH